MENKGRIIDLFILKRTFFQVMTGAGSPRAWQVRVTDCVGCLWFKNLGVVTKWGGSEMVWCDCVVWLCGVTVWCDCVVWLCGVIVWCDCVVWLCGVTVWCDYVVWLCGVIVWCDCVVWLCGVIVWSDYVVWLCGVIVWWCYACGVVVVLMVMVKVVLWWWWWWWYWPQWVYYKSTFSYFFSIGQMKNLKCSMIQMVKFLIWPRGSFWQSVYLVGRCYIRMR